MTRVVPSFALLLISALTLGCGGPSAPTASPAVTVSLSARDSKFESLVLQVAPGTPFAIAFTNYDSIPHNVTIQGTPTRMSGEIFSGPGERTYVFPALTAGDYGFVCDVHPEMVGELQVH
jgi:plastocyanin